MENIFANLTSDKVLVCRIYKELSRLNGKKTNDKNGQKISTSEKNMNEKHVRCLTSCVNREIQIKTKKVSLHNFYND